jgi:hypothetical protein
MLRKKSSNNKQIGDREQLVGKSSNKLSIRLVYLVQCLHGTSTGTQEAELLGTTRAGSLQVRAGVQN